MGFALTNTKENTMRHVYIITPDLNIEERYYRTEEELTELYIIFGGAIYRRIEEAEEAIENELHRRYAAA